MTSFWRRRRGARATIAVAAAYALALQALLLGALGARLAGPPDAFGIICVAAGDPGDPGDPSGGHASGRHGTACVLACAQAGAAPPVAAATVPAFVPAPAQDLRFAVRQDRAPVPVRVAAFDARGPPRLG
ncbi:MAG TPA: DUF2946 family protein [Beijerinckiaceae bacterium]|jgi:type II secretory pathway pseudopilin PulG